MARTVKKKKELTLEEKIEQALVPVEEQPYQVPENWCWIRFGEITINYDKKRIPLSAKQRSLLDKVYDYYGASGIIDKVDKYIFDQELLLIGEDGANLLYRSTDIAFLASGKYWVNNHAHIVDTLICSRQYMKYYINSIDLSPFITGTAQPKLTQDNMNSIPIPIPPAQEQQRIVDRIESLFAKLDEAKDKAQAVVDGFEDRKAAILHKAFTGELTAGWRKNKGFTEKGWQKKTIGEFSFVTKLAGFEYTNNIAPNLVETGIPLFKGKNVQQGKLVLEFESFIPKEVSDELSRSKITKKCLLTPYVGTIGNIAIFDGSFEAHLGSNVGKIEIESDTFEEFLLYYLRSDLGYRELTKEKKATAQESISIKAIRNVVVLLPKMDEQLEIVSVLDCLINKEQQAKEAAEQVISQIDTMKKSILARAFRGELGTNDPADESAVELLKRVL